MMIRLTKRCHLWGWLFLVLLTAPVNAHTAKVSEDIAATFHIEPNHNPKTGKPALAWFVLTQRGGTLIALTQCRCQLAVYLSDYKKGEVPIMEPTLKPISTASYKDIPGVDIIFSKPGEYALEISGAPKAGAQFKPFKLSYKVTVTGRPMANDATLNSSPQRKEPVKPSNPLMWSIIVPTGLSAAALTAMALRRKSRRKR
jgi:hypothetical protein